MDLKDLELFLAVSRSGSINKAAENMFLAQSTVTHRLKQLEKQLQTVLFIRTAVGVSLTPEGKQLIPIATSIVEQMRMFCQQTQTGRKPLSMVAGRGFAAYELPRLLSAYRKTHPEFTCYVKSTLYEEAVSALLTGSADVALLGSEVYHPKIEQVSLPSDRIVLIVSRFHAWAGEFPSFAKWGNQEVIAFADASAPFRQRIDRFLAENGVYANVIMELDSFGAIKKMVEQNLGVAMLPERILEEELKQGSLVAHDIAEGHLTRPTLLAYAKHKRSDQVFDDFISWICSVY